MVAGSSCARTPSDGLGILKGDASKTVLDGGADRRKASSLVNGKVLDVALLAAVVIAFFASATFDPGVGTAMIALVGVLALGYYNSYVRHDPTEDREGLRGEPPGVSARHPACCLALNRNRCSANLGRRDTSRTSALAVADERGLPWAFGRGFLAGPARWSVTCGCRGSRSRHTGSGGIWVNPYPQTRSGFHFKPAHTPNELPDSTSCSGPSPPKQICNTCFDSPSCARRIGCHSQYFEHDEQMLRTHPQVYALDLLKHAVMCASRRARRWSQRPAMSVRSRCRGWR
jgi:hypothetical protein